MGSEDNSLKEPNEGMDFMFQNICIKDYRLSN